MLLHLAKSAVFIAGILLATPDAGAQWQPDVRLTTQPATSFTPFNYRSIAAGGGVLNIVWYDERDGNFEIYSKRSTNDGATWGPDTRLTISAGTSWFSSVAVSGSAVHIIWMDNRDGNFEIYTKRSVDRGVTWLPDTRLTFDAAPSRFPSIAVSDSVVNVIWQDHRDGNAEIYTKRSADGGVSWSADTRLTFNAADSIFATVTSSGSIVNVLWEEYRDGNPEIYAKRSPDGGLSWSADMRLTINAAISFSPNVWSSGREVHAVWYDTRDGNSEVYYKRSTNGGITWGADTRMTNHSGGSFHPSITASGSSVHLSWWDERDGDTEVYYKVSTDAGLSWGTDTRLTTSADDSGHPAVAVSGQVVHVLWQDHRDGNWEIYYKRNPMGNPMVADLDGDGIVDGLDLGILLAQWAARGSADLNHDGTVNGIDLGILLANWTL